MFSVLVEASLFQLCYVGIGTFATPVARLYPENSGTAMLTAAAAIREQHEASIALLTREKQSTTV